MPVVNVPNWCVGWMHCIVIFSRRWRGRFQSITHVNIKRHPTAWNLKFHRTKIAKTVNGKNKNILFFVDFFLFNLM